ncbi:hypothetical protein I4U23_013032 [Adineta vaga]|nr:hypothetical protein I4U23_013032 [Adineta vaga]
MDSKCFKIMTIVTLFVFVDANPLILNKRNILPTDMKNTYANHYGNIFFGISIDKPEGWHVMNTSQLIPVLQRFGNLIVTNGSDLVGSTSLILENKLLPLFGFLKYPYGTLGNSNPNLVCIVEGALKGTVTDNSCRTIPYTKNDMTHENISLSTGETESNCRVVDLNGKTFIRKQSMMIIDDRNVLKQIQYTRQTNNDSYYFLFTLSYTDDDSKQQLENIMKSLKMSR